MFEKINKIVLFLIIFLTSSFVVVNDIVSTSIMILLWVVVLGLLLMQTKSIKRNQLLILIFLLASIWCTVLVNGEEPLISVKLSFAFISIFLYSNIVDFETFKNDYISIMFYICIISLGGAVLFSMFPALKNSFVYQNQYGNVYSCLYFYIHPYGYFRNYGLFWEPGAFQTFIGLALLFESMKPNKQHSKLKMIIFIIAMITTFSTTGYFVLALLLLLNFNKKGSNLKAKAGITIVVLLIVLFAYFNQQLFFSTSTNSPFGKLISSFGNGNVFDSSVRNSTTIRINSIIYPFIEYLKHPIFGCGYAGLNRLTYSYTYNINTCTFVNWFAVYGTLFGLIMFSGFIKLAKKISSNVYELLTVFLILLLLIISENYVNNAFFMMLTLFGFKKTKQV